ncbi:MAG: cellulase family glycosylhydrolase [Thermoleophilaceae bacterium]|nr:cellulase family glycosylhydrolase [Thermoleophilaceae bacterium]
MRFTTSRTPDSQRPRTRALLAIAIALTGLAVGCRMETKPPTNVTSSSATLNAQVPCTSGDYGPVLWDLREAGHPTWEVVGAEERISCSGSSGSTRIFERVAGLRAGAGYEFRVAVNPPPSGGPWLHSEARRFSTGGGSSSPKPVVVPSSGTTPATLRSGSAGGGRLQLRGVNVWGLQDSITTSFGAGQYANRSTVASTIKSWGANLVRFRLLADDYNSAPSAATGNLTKAQIIQRIMDWRDTVVGRGMYFMLCSWDALDGAHSDAGWAGNGHRVHQMFADIRAALGDDPMVIYEVTNEPNNVSWAQWEANMQGSIRHFRETLGYKGLLVIDPIWWANSGTGGQGYDDARYSGLEAYDAALPGMGSHQLAFAKHDYATEYANKAWDPDAWRAAQGGSQIKHLIFETEFGNYNGSPSSVSAAWAAGAASFFAGRFATQQNYVGAAAFVFGPWFDANAMNAANGQNPTAWGTSVKDKLLGG